MDNLEDHPIAACWPLMEKDDIAKLAESIRANGQLLPITLHEGKILDGRNRYRACALVHVKPWTAVFDGADPIQFAKSVNEDRRHETPSQRAMIAAKLANIKNGNILGQKSGRSIDQPLISREKAAEIMKVGNAQIGRAKRVLAQASPEVIAKVETGEMSVNAATKTLPPTEAAAPSVKTKPKPYKRIFDHAQKHWAKAKLHLDKIQPCDFSREKVLKEIVIYCQRRLSVQK